MNSDQSSAPGAYRIVLSVSPAVAATFHDDLVWLQEIALKRQRHEADSEAESPMPRLLELGLRLGALAFPTEEALGEFAAALAAAQKAEHPLRVEIHTDSQEVAALPWEFMRLDHERPEVQSVMARTGTVLQANDGFLAFDTRLVLVRVGPQSMSTARQNSLRPEERIRILLVAEPNPGKLGRAYDERSWAERPDVSRQIEDVRRLLVARCGERADIRVLDGRPGDEVRAVINEFKPHVVHFTGHGALPSEAPIKEPALVLAGRDGYAMYLEASEFTRLCKDAGVRVVVLNCCNLAAVDVATIEASQSLAYTLTGAGVPLTIAMQVPLYEDVARSFAWLLYQWLLEGRSIDAAIARHRQQYLERNTVRDIAWGAPVVYSSVRDTVIFPAQVGRQNVKQDFSELLIEYSFDFIGRQWLLKKIDNYIAAPEKRVLYLSGPVGIGKSAVLAACARKYPEATHAFYRYGEFSGALDCARHVLRALDPQATPEVVGATLEAQIAAAINAVGDKLRTLAETEQKIVIIIDGLDESQNPADALPIPDTLLSHLPANVAVVIGARPDWYAQWRSRHPGAHGSVSIDADPRFRHLPLEPLSAENLRDTAWLIFRQLQDHRSGVASLRQCEGLARIVHGNFLVITILGDLFGPQIPLKTIEDLYKEAAALTLGPEGVSGLYQLYFDRRVAAHPVFQHDMPVVKKLLGVLGSTLEPISVQQMRSLLNAAHPEEPAATGPEVERGLRHVRRFLRTGEFRRQADSGEPEITHLPYHASFATYAQHCIGARRIPERRLPDFSAATAKVYARAWADYCLGWSKLNAYARHYALRNLPQHLMGCGKDYVTQLTDTLLDYGYMAAAIGARPGSPRPLVIDELLVHYSDATAPTDQADTA